METETDDAVFPQEVPVKLSRGAEVVFRELVIEDVPKITREIVQLFQSLPPDLFSKASTEEGDAATSDNMAIFSKALEQPELLEAFKRIIEVVTDSKKGTFDRLSLRDFPKCVRAFLKCNPLEDLKDLLLEIKATLGVLPTQTKTDEMED